MRILKDSFLLFLLLSTPLILSRTSWGMAHSITLSSSTEVQFDDRTCIEATGIMNGTAPGGEYSVPITLLYPKDFLESNATAIVEPFNNTIEQNTFLDTGGSSFFLPLSPSRGYLGDPFLCKKGYVYMSVQWDKNALQIAELSNHPMNGFISLETDGYQIIPDAGRCLKDPACASENLPEIKQVIASGFSTSTFILRSIFIPSCIDDSVDKDNSFDAINQGGTGPQILVLTNDPSPFGSIPSISFCPGTTLPGIKTIVINDETEPEILAAFLLREETPDSRVYEIAGTSHINTKSGGDMSFLGAQHQNPVDIGPVHRAMMEHLRKWIRGEESPPHSAYLNGPIGTHTPQSGSLFFATVFDYARDADKNSLGGIRLPHMPTKVKGQTLGAPLASYKGFEESLAPADYPVGIVFRRLFVELAGHWAPFPNDKLNVLFPKHGDYVSAVAKAAGYDFGQGWILEEDREAYVERASKCEIGKSKNITPTERDFCTGL